MQYHRIQPIPVDGFADANGVVVNEHGAWLGEVDHQPDGSRSVALYCDGSSGSRIMPYVPAPKNWRSLVIEEIQDA